VSFSSLSTLSVTLGLLGLAGGLYLLQRLRVRHQEIDVVTTLFWREAVEETRARVLVRRFRHPLAYLLVLAIASLLWLAFAAPERGVQAGREYVCLLDTSAGMGHGNRLEAARERLFEVASELPTAHRRVLLCGGSVRTALAPGEETVLLEERLEGIEAQAAVSSVQLEIERLATAGTGEMTILVFGGELLDEERLALLPVGFEVQRVDIGDVGTAGNSGITALGISLASSGVWDTVDVLVELSGDDLEQSGTLGVRLDGKNSALVAEPVRSGERQRIFIFRDVPARGQRLEVSLSGGDSLVLDDRATILLPDRPILRVGLSPGLEGSLRPALDADPAVEVVDSGATLFLVHGQEATPDGVPALRFVPASEQTESFLVTFDGDREAEEVLLEVVGSLGLDEIDTTGLAEGAARPITIGARSGEVREIAVWDELRGDDYDFVDSRSFPLFIARCCRWLVATDELRSWAVAGEAIDERVAFIDSGAVTLDPVGAPFTPPRAGEYTDGDGAELSVALLAPEATAAPPKGGLADPTAGIGGDPVDPVTWLLALAGALLLVEWILVRKGRMP
jgi:hypothetical protein